jgi:hypothetical protein
MASFVAAVDRIPVTTPIHGTKMAVAYIPQEKTTLAATGASLVRKKQSCQMEPAIVKHKKMQAPTRNRVYLLSKDDFNLLHNDFSHLSEHLVSSFSLVGRSIRSEIPRKSSRRTILLANIPVNNHIRVKIRQERYHNIVCLASQARGIFFENAACGASRDDGINGK